MQAMSEADDFHTRIEEIELVLEDKLKQIRAQSKRMQAHVYTHACERRARRYSLEPVPTRTHVGLHTRPSTLLYCDMTQEELSVVERSVHKMGGGGPALNRIDSGIAMSM